MTDRKLVTLLLALLVANLLVAASRRTARAPSPAPATRPADSATLRMNVLRAQRAQAQEQARSRGNSTYVFETAVLPPAIGGR